MMNSETFFKKYIVFSSRVCQALGFLGYFYQNLKKLPPEEARHLPYCRTLPLYIWVTSPSRDILSKTCHLFFKA